MEEEKFEAVFLESREHVYKFLLEFLYDPGLEESWREWISEMMGFEEPQTKEVLIERAEKMAKTAKMSRKFGI